MFSSHGVFTRTNNGYDAARRCQVVGVVLHQAEPDLLKTLGHPTEITLLEPLCERGEAGHQVAMTALGTTPSRTRCGWSPTGRKASSRLVSKSITATASLPLSETQQVLFRPSVVQ